MGSRSGARQRTQLERREQSRAAILEAAARGLSRGGYSHLSLEQVAREAGYTRGALYHQFAGKEDLALAVVTWVSETWQEQVGTVAGHEDDPVAELIGLARGHAVFCRSDIARVRMALAVEFSGRDHPLADALSATEASAIARFTKLIRTARRRGLAPAGPPAGALAAGLFGALEGLVIQLAGQAPHDVVLAERLVTGLLGLPVREAGSGSARASLTGTTRVSG